MSNRHLNFGEEQHAEINRGKGADVTQKAGEDFGKPSGPRTVLSLQPRAQKAWRQPQGPFGSSLQLNNLLMTIAEIHMLVLIHVRLMVVPSPPLVLLLHLPPSGPRYEELCTANNKKANLEKNAQDETIGLSASQTACSGTTAARHHWTTLPELPVLAFSSSHHLRTRRSPGSGRTALEQK